MLLCASVLLLGWSFYKLYVLKVRSPVTAVITWLSLVFILGFWTWHLARGVWSSGNG